MTENRPTDPNSPPETQDDAAPLGRLTRQLTLQTQVEQLLRQAIVEGRFATDRLPTEVELAEQLQVSRETVRRATKTLAAEGLVVKYRRRGTFLRSPEPMRLSTATLVGYLQADYGTTRSGRDTATQFVNGLMLQGVLETVGEAGFGLLVKRAKPADLPETYEQLQRHARPRGLIFASVGEENLLRRVLGSGTPAVLLDHELHLPQVPTVRSDSAQAMAEAVRYLADLGHRRIALAYWNRLELNPWGLEGYRKALRQRRLQRRRAWELFADISAEGAGEVVAAWQRLSPRPTALICFNNTFARLMIETLASAGFLVPDDLSIVGCGGEEWPGLTSQQSDSSAMGQKAAELLLKTISNPSDEEPEHALVPHILHEGRTAAAPPDRGS